LPLGSCLLFSVLTRMSHLLEVSGGDGSSRTEGGSGWRARAGGLWEGVGGGGTVATFYIMFPFFPDVLVFRERSPSSRTISINNGQFFEITSKLQVRCIDPNLPLTRSFFGESAPH